MAARKIRIWPDPVLKQVAKSVSRFDENLKMFVDEMFETMYKEHGVGLAANQVGVPERIFVIDLDPNGQAEDDAEAKSDLAATGFTGPMVLINPEIVAAEGDIRWEEGCLSVPGVSEMVKRKERVRVKALDITGKEFTLEASGLFAIAIQHETDHLNGRVFVEYLSKLKRDVIRRKMERRKADDESDAADAAVSESATEHSGSGASL